MTTSPYLLPEPAENDELQDLRSSGAAQRGRALDRGTAATTTGPPRPSAVQPRIARRDIFALMRVRARHDEAFQIARRQFAAQRLKPRRVDFG